MCFGLEVNSSSAAFNLLWTTKGQTERNSVPSSACAAGGSANWLLVVRRRNDLHTFTHTFWQIVQVLCAQGISKVSMISVKPFHFRILLSLLPLSTMWSVVTVCSFSKILTIGLRLVCVPKVFLPIRITLKRFLEGFLVRLLVSLTKVEKI